MTKHRGPDRRGHVPPSWTAEQRLAYRTKVDVLTGCHLWQGSLTERGYGRVAYRGRHQIAHRLAWTLKHGPIPKGMDVCHRCDRRHCINPDHHFLDSRSGNMRDFTRKRRARIERAFGDERGRGGLPDDATRNEITPIRLYIGGVEIVGEAVIRPFDPNATSFRAASDSADTRPGARYTRRRHPGG